MIDVFASGHMLSRVFDLATVKHGLARVVEAAPRVRELARQHSPDDGAAIISPLCLIDYLSWLVVEYEDALRRVALLEQAREDPGAATLAAFRAVEDGSATDEQRRLAEASARCRAAIGLPPAPSLECVPPLELKRPL